MTPLLALGASIALLLSIERRLSPTSLLLVSMIPPVWGFQTLSLAWGSPPGSWLVPSIVLAVSVGAIAHRLLVSPLRPPPHPTHFNPRGLRWVTLGICIFAATHFALVGVPALSGGAETARFALGSSGLLGFPSRSLLFGLPILALITAVHRECVPQTIYRCIWAAFILSRLLMGFKGGLLEVAVLAATAAIVRARPLKLKAVSYAIAALVAALAYASWIGSRYQSIARTGGVTSDYLAERLTIGAATPGWYALTLNGRSVIDKPVFVHDLQYFLSKYFHLGAGPRYAWDQIISSFVTGTPRTGGAFLVPVTTGGPAYLIRSLPPIGVLLAAVLIGFALAQATKTLAAGAAYFPLVLSAATLISARVFMLNGAGIYLLINFAFTLLLIMLPYFGQSFLAGLSVTSRRRLPLRLSTPTQQDSSSCAN